MNNNYGYGVSGSGDAFWEFMRLENDKDVADSKALRIVMFRQYQLTMSLLDQIRILNEQIHEIKSELRTR